MFDFLEELLREFKDIPGLSMLRRLHTMVMLKNARFRERVQTMQNKKNDMVVYSQRVRRLTRTSKGAKRRED